MNLYSRTIIRIAKRIHKNRKVSGVHLFIIYCLLVFLTIWVTTNIFINKIAVITVLFILLFIFLSMGFIIIAFLAEKELYEKSLQYLYDSGLKKISNFFYEGNFKDYRIQFILMNDTYKDGMSLEKNLFVVYYTDNLEDITSNECHSETTDLGYIIYSSSSLKLVPNNRSTTNFKNCLNGLIRYIKEKDFKPISKVEWDLIYIKGRNYKTIKIPVDEK